MRVRGRGSIERVFVRRPMTPEELEQIRRSLAMAPSLPGESARRLLDEVRRLRGDVQLTLEMLDQLRAHLRCERE